jgi:hypothetical protein
VGNSSGKFSKDRWWSPQDLNAEENPNFTPTPKDKDIVDSFPASLWANSRYK